MIFRTEDENNLDIKLGQLKDKVETTKAEHEQLQQEKD